MIKHEREAMADILMRADSMVRGLLAGRGPLKAFPEGIQEFLADLQRARGQCIPETLAHGAGAYARCSFCGRYTANPCALSSGSVQQRAACDCEKPGGWCGSFKPPGPDAKWSIGLEREP
jgi:hypothetical protein